MALSLGACREGPALQVLGDTTRLEAGEPSPARSPFFDGNEVRLRGARGETLGFSIRTADDKNRRVTLELSVENVGIQAFAVRSLEVEEPSTEMYGASLGRGRYPDVLVPAAGGVETSELAFFDVAIGQSARPGRYRGTLQLGERTLPVVLDVSRARIDLHPEPLVWVFYLPKEIARVHGLPEDDGPALLAKEREYYELFRAHGALLATNLRPSRFPPRKQFMKDVRYWPVSIDIASEDSIARDVRTWLDYFRGTGVTPFTIPIDEPHTQEQKERTRAVAEAIGRAGGGRPALLRAVTARKEPVYGDQIDLYFSPDNIPDAAKSSAASGERFWTYNGRPPQAGSMILDTDGTALRTWGWIAERYDIELWYAWEGLYFSDRYNRGGETDVMLDPITFDERSRGGEDWGNGDGLLVYPGPLPSLRLKALRRGLQDRLLVRKLESCGGGAAAREIVAEMMPRALAAAKGKPSWSKDEVVWERARAALLEKIEGACRD
ncbi:MAG TPA: DUF4091 domain-containing protein [Polyangiaceae bacterium]